MAASNIFETWYFVAETIKNPYSATAKGIRSYLSCLFYFIFFISLFPWSSVIFPFQLFLCHKAQFYTMANLSENTSVDLTQLQIKFVAVFLVVPLKFDTASTGGFVLTETSDLIA